MQHLMVIVGSSSFSIHHINEVNVAPNKRAIEGVALVLALMLMQWLLACRVDLAPDKPVVEEVALVLVLMMPRLRATFSNRISKRRMTMMREIAFCTFTRDTFLTYVPTLQ